MDKLNIKDQVKQWFDSIMQSTYIDSKEKRKLKLYCKYGYYDSIDPSTFHVLDKLNKYLSSSEYLESRMNEIFGTEEPEEIECDIEEFSNKINYDNCIIDEVGKLTQSELNECMKEIYKRNNSVRRTGKTTRLVDKYIQDLFQNNEVHIKDHHNHYRAHKYVFDKVLNRLEHEHRMKPIKFTIREDGSYIIQGLKYIMPK